MERLDFIQKPNGEPLDVRLFNPPGLAPGEACYPSYSSTQADMHLRNREYASAHANRIAKLDNPIPS